MRVTIANISKTIKEAPFQHAVRAVARQVADDFQPEWGVTAKITGVMTRLEPGKLAPIQGNREAIIYLGDSSRDATTGVKNALGYHSENHKGVAYGFVYLDVCKEYDESWTCTLSHEVLELLADPTASLTVTGPSVKAHQGRAYYDLEVCDPTQGDTYEIDSIVVSNFVGRSYFGLMGGSGKTNFLDLELQAFGVRPGGYFQFEENGKVGQVDGKKVTDKIRQAKAAINEMAATARRNNRRGLGLPRIEA